MTANQKKSKLYANRYSPSPIPQVQQANSTSFDTTAQTIKPLQIFQCLPIRRKSYAFQLLKQFILFSSQSQDSISQNQYQTKKSFNLETAEIGFSQVFSITNRIRQKFLLLAFDKMKKIFIRKKMVYRNKQYVENIVQKITNLIKEEHKQVLQFVFIELIHNMKICKAQQIFSNNSKNSSIPQFIQYQDKNFKAKQQLPFHTDQHSGILRNDTESFFQSDSRIQIAKDFGLKKFNFSNQLTPHKQIHQEQYVRTTRSRKNSQTQNRQNIYLIRDDIGQIKTSRKRSVKKYIKIPLQSDNINIVEINSLVSAKKRELKGQKSTNCKSLNQKIKFQKGNHQEYQCQDCMHCKKIKLQNNYLKKIFLNL